MLPGHRQIGRIAIFGLILKRDLGRLLGRKWLILSANATPLSVDLPILDLHHRLSLSLVVVATQTPIRNNHRLIIALLYFDRALLM